MEIGSSNQNTGVVLETTPSGTDTGFSLDLGNPDAAKLEKVMGGPPVIPPGLALDAGAMPVTGTNDTETLTGSDAPRERFFTGEGDDTAYGMGGYDIMFGQGGNDLIFGNQGDDFIDGGVGNDTLFGGQGDDEVSGGEGDDVLFGDRGDDILTGGAGDDVIIGGEGNDTAVFEGPIEAYMISVNDEGDVVVIGNDGTDTLTGVENFEFGGEVFTVDQLRERGTFQTF
ncbi:calcium-binding protein [Salinarimonas ramus]|uniref:Hemolysin expression modulating protein n=1 Tax=Salinarimonas ramus TaxID=690164 RepID=A0A917V1X5_9HYPH|nr:calcium-binding protein [Salinarimonas ramus]GGK19170.1 hemolysin expression modulating protein [Salinarimonas ramus]